ncbi:flagellar hook-basal body protein [Oceanobacillus sp. J11TS1]|uniref:flagellar hook-basal body protein n=1 Tax=Oceanobacillus sp. J11TS1 TaxID=2807191 RepID=UPI001B1D242D|nr:flagellar hook-basal body protein [Oceanobacillus sp. J11TS1]GIO25250.1 flagellar hook-basal body complex protein FlhO [Oceanobacillus sp. J11TS1]
MLRGLYTAASGMITQQRQQEALSNNIANANTPGYKADQTAIRAFPELLIEQMGDTNRAPGGPRIPASRQLGGLNTGVYVQETIPDFAQGALTESGLPTDVAINQREVPDENGAIFFAVQNNDGDVRLTRNGNFSIDADGYLVTSQGHYVLDENGNNIQTNGSMDVVSEEGVIQAAGGEVTLGTQYVADVNTLTKEGNDLFQGDAEAVPANAVYSIEQGVLEQSNVNSAQAMTDMMNAYRMFETNQRVLRVYDESLGKAVTEIGRLS